MRNNICKIIISCAPSICLEFEEQEWCLDKGKPRLAGSTAVILVASSPLARPSSRPLISTPVYTWAVDSNLVSHLS